MRWLRASPPQPPAAPGLRSEGSPLSEGRHWALRTEEPGEARPQLYLGDSGDMQPPPWLLRPSLLGRPERKQKAGRAARAITICPQWGMWHFRSPLDWNITLKALSASVGCYSVTNRNEAPIHAKTWISVEKRCPIAADEHPPAPAPLRRPWRTQFQSPGRPSGCRLYGASSLPAGSACAERFRRRGRGASRGAWFLVSKRGGLLASGWWSTPARGVTRGCAPSPAPA